MWPTKAMMFRITADCDAIMDVAQLGEKGYRAKEELDKKLAARPSKLPEPSHLNTYGFFPIQQDVTLADINEDPGFLEAEETPEYVRSIAGGHFLVITAAEHYRNLPSSVVRRTLQEKVTEVERSQMRKVYKKERDQMKDEVVQDLLPKAFIMVRYTHAMIDTERKLIWVFASVARHAEALLSTLRECIGSLPCRPLTTKMPPTVMFTRWVRDQECDNGFNLLDSALMEDTCEGGGKIGMVHQDLTGEEAQLCVQNGKIVTKVAFCYEDKVSMILNDKLIFTRMRFEDALTDQVEFEHGEEGNRAVVDASYFLAGCTLQEMLDDLLDGMGGEDVPQML